VAAPTEEIVYKKNGRMRSKKKTASPLSPPHTPTLTLPTPSHPPHCLTHQPVYPSCGSGTRFKLAFTTAITTTFFSFCVSHHNVKMLSSVHPAAAPLDAATACHRCVS
jgi:hypothetical protein